MLPSLRRVVRPMTQCSQFMENPVSSNLLSNLQSIRFATKKAGGSVKNTGKTVGKRLGVKKFGGEHVIPGNIIIRQRGKRYHHDNVTTKLGRDYTVYAVKEGWVKFENAHNAREPKRSHQVVTVSDVNPNPQKKERPEGWVHPFVFFKAGQRHKYKGGMNGPPVMDAAELLGKSSS